MLTTFMIFTVKVRCHHDAVCALVGGLLGAVKEHLQLCGDSQIMNAAAKYHSTDCVTLGYDGMCGAGQWQRSNSGAPQELCRHEEQ